MTVRIHQPSGDDPGDDISREDSLPPAPEGGEVIGIIVLGVVLKTKSGAIRLDVIDMDLDAPEALRKLDASLVRGETQYGADFIETSIDAKIVEDTEEGDIQRRCLSSVVAGVTSGKSYVEWVLDRSNSPK